MLHRIIAVLLVGTGEQVRTGLNASKHTRSNGPSNRTKIGRSIEMVVGGMGVGLAWDAGVGMGAKSDEGGGQLDVFLRGEDDDLARPLQLLCRLRRWAV